MKAFVVPLCTVALILGGAAAPAAPTSDRAIPTVDGMVSATRTVELRVAMRKLWEDHITYTRNYIISALADLPDSGAVATRLLANQDEIGDAIKPFYGEAAGEALAGLLRDHILIATEVIAAARSGDATQYAAAQAEWSANGQAIAAFLAGANPYWSQVELETMLQTHLDLTTDEVVARLNADWEGDIGAYDEGHVHMLMFADVLTTGIARQFPSRVGK
jgi:hypothetical protein